MESDETINHASERERQNVALKEEAPEAVEKIGDSGHCIIWTQFPIDAVALIPCQKTVFSIFLIV
jgi:hypothetical protein